MGRKLIIQGADFSTNGIDGYTPTFNDLVSCVVGKGWAISGASTPPADVLTRTTNAARVSCNIVDFTNIGVESITITPKSGFKVATFVSSYIVENGTLPSNSYVAWSESYNTEQRTLSSVDGSKFIVMVAPTSSSVTSLTSDNWDTYITTSLVFT